MVNGSKGPWEVEQNLVIQATLSQPTSNFIAAVIDSFCVCFHLLQMLVVPLLFYLPALSKASGYSSLLAGNVGSGRINPLEATFTL